MIKELKEYLPNFKDGYYTTSDNVKIHYRDGGEGEPLILTSGWPTSPCIFAFNLPEISKHFRVIAMETRGTGASDKPNHGYRMSRIAMDVYDMLKSLKIEKANFMGHSMGANVILAFIDLFGQNMIKKFIFIDQSPWLWSDPYESDESMNSHGGHRGHPYTFNKGFNVSWEEGQKIFDSKDFFETAPTTLAQSTPNGLRVLELEGIMKKHFNYDSKQLVKLVINHYMTDWRDVLNIIEVPTLLIVGENTHALTMECANLMLKSLKNGELVVFTKEEYGNHIMMANSPEKFNRVVIEFLEKK